MSIVYDLPPCLKCLVKVPCRSKIIRTKKDGEKEYLIMEFVRKCPDAFTYFYKQYIEDPQGKHQHQIKYQEDFHGRVKIFCDTHNLPDSPFLWYGNEIGIYEY